MNEDEVDNHRVVEVILDDGISVIAYVKIPNSDDVCLKHPYQIIYGCFGEISLIEYLPKLQDRHINIKSTDILAVAEPLDIIKDKYYNLIISRQSNETLH